MKAAVVCCYLHTTGLVLLICMKSHQAKLIEVCEQSPGVYVSQAAPDLQVCECSQKHLKATKEVREREREWAQAIGHASIKFPLL